MHVLVTKGKKMEKFIENYFFRQEAALKGPETTANTKEPSTSEYILPIHNIVLISAVSFTSIILDS